MKNLLYLALFCMVFVTACGDDNDGNGGSGGADGDLTITLTWEQGDADLDLDLVGPNNLIITSGFSSLNGASHSGDDLTGPGEERIEFMNVAEDGTYTINLEWFSGFGDVSYDLVIESAETTRSLSGTLNATDDSFITTFTKSGRSLTF